MELGKQQGRWQIHRGYPRAAVILVLGFSLASPPQQPRSPQMPAPPPMKFIPPGERAQLSEARDPKARTRATVELADAHISRAEELTEKKKYDLAADELGNYLALIEDALKFLGKLNSHSGKTRDLYKRLDLALRAHLPHLARMRRSTPAEYGFNIKDAEEFARNARSKALDPFYGQKAPGDADGKSSGDKAKSPSPPSNKEP